MDMKEATAMLNSIGYHLVENRNLLFRAGDVFTGLYDPGPLPRFVVVFCGRRVSEHRASCLFRPRLPELERSLANASAFGIDHPINSIYCGIRVPGESISLSTAFRRFPIRVRAQASKFADLLEFYGY